MNGRILHKGVVLSGIFAIAVIAGLDGSITLCAAETVASESRPVTQKIFQEEDSMNVPIDAPPIRTPATSPKPRINGARVFGVRLGSPFLYSIAASGQRPMQFEAEGLPDGLRIDKATGRIDGRIDAPGEHRVTLRAANDLGAAERELRIVVGEEIALTPPMGWNSWNCWAGKVDRDKVIQSAQGMVESGLSQHGWTYINIDDAWQGLRGGPFNAIQPNEKFPDMKGLCDTVHNLGLKTGIYSTPWITSYGNHCGGSSNFADGRWPPLAEKEGEKGKSGKGEIGEYCFEEADARQWAEWGVDYLKYDWRPINFKYVERMAAALRASGRDIVYSLSSTSPVEDAKNWTQLVNSWRTGPDIRGSWTRAGMPRFVGVFDYIEVSEPWHLFTRPGHYADPDMLVVGQLGWGKPLRPTGLTPDEQYLHMSMWCLWASPLLIGCPLDQLDAFTLNLLTNDELIDINQEPLCKQARRVYMDPKGAQVWAKEMEDGSLAVGLINTGEKTLKVEARWTDLKISGPRRLRDVWRQRELGEFNGEFGMDVAPHGAEVVRVH